MSTAYKEWSKFTKTIEKSKDIIEQLSKLYIIIHENVRTMMRKCSTNPSIDIKQQAQSHLLFIKNILLRLNESYEDQYLQDVQHKLIVKYQQQLFNLVEQIECTLKVQESKINLNVKQLMSIRREHINNAEHHLKKQLKESQRRRIRSKSGHRGSQSNKSKIMLQSKVPINHAQYEQLIPSLSEQKPACELLINDIKSFKISCMKKKFQLQKKTKTHVQHKNHEVYFGKKYQDNNLEMYFQERKQFADLMFSDAHYNKILESSQNYDATDNAKIMINQNKKDLLQNNLFSQFKIKTKFMKERVKDNILLALVDVKKQLLKQYHEGNIGQINNGNQGGMISLVQGKKRIKAEMKTCSEKMFKKMGETATSPMRATNYSTSKYKIAQRTTTPAIYFNNDNWSREIENEYKCSIGERFKLCKIQPTW